MSSDSSAWNASRCPRQASNAPSAVERGEWRRESGGCLVGTLSLTLFALCPLSVLFNAAARSPPTGSPPARPRRLCLPIHSQLARCVSPGSPSPPSGKAARLIAFPHPRVSAVSRSGGDEPASVRLLTAGSPPRQLTYHRARSARGVLSVPHAPLLLPACLPFLCDSVCVMFDPRRLAPPFLPSFLLSRLPSLFRWPPSLPLSTGAPAL